MSEEMTKDMKDLNSIIEGIQPDNIKPFNKRQRKENIEFVKEIVKQNYTNEYIIPFGKYKGKEFNQVLNFDRKYLQWLYKQQFIKEFKTLYTLMQNAKL